MKKIQQKNNILVKIIAVAVVILTAIIAITQITRPYVFLDNWHGVSELVSTAIEEYEDYKDDENWELHSDVLYGEKTSENIKELSHAVEKQATDNSIVVMVISVVSTAICCVILFHKTSSNKK